MEQLHATPLSHLTDEEFQRHLLHKEEPTAEDVEAMLRFELLLGSYTALLEQVNRLAHEGLYGEGSKHDALLRISQLTAGN